MSNWFTDATGIKIGPSKDMQGWLGINENYETMTPKMIQTKKESEAYNKPQAQFQRDMDKHIANYKEQQTFKENKMANNSAYEDAINEEMYDPGNKYDLPGYEGPVLQSFPPKIQIDGEYVTLVQNPRGDWTYPNAGPEAAAFEAREDQEFFDERSRLGTLPQGYDAFGPLSERNPSRDAAYAASPEGDPASNPEAIENYKARRSYENDVPLINGRPSPSYPNVPELSKGVMHGDKEYLYGTSPRSFLNIWR